MNHLKLVVSIIIGFSLCTPAIASPQNIVPQDFLNYLKQETNSIKKVETCLDHLNNENDTVRYNAELEMIRFYQFETPNGETHNIILALIKLQDDLTFEQSTREHARLILEAKKTQYLQYLENGKEENLKSNIWFNLKHPLRSWDSKTYKLAAWDGYAQRREALKRIPLMDGSLSEIMEMLLYYQNYAAFDDEKAMAREGMQYIIDSHNPTIVTSALVNFIDTNPNKTRDRLIGWKEDKICTFTDAINYVAQIRHHHALDYLEKLHEYAYINVKPDLRIQIEESLNATYHTEENLPFEQAISTARRAVDEYMASSLYAEKNSQSNH